MKTADEIQISYAESKGFGNFDLLIEKEVSALDYHVQKVQEIYADQFKPKWISVKDALPDPSQHVVWLLNSDDLIDEPAVCASMNHEWFNIEHFSHWMPLPNTPQP